MATAWIALTILAGSACTPAKERSTAAQTSTRTGADETGGTPETTDTADNSNNTDNTDNTDTADTAAPTWRSTLYPADWTPGFSTDAGTLRDFSHAGYRGSNTDLPRPALHTATSVLDHGADPTGAVDSTAAIQAAIDAAPEAGPHLVHLPAGAYRIVGTLRITRSEVVLAGDGSDRTSLFFTQSEGLDHGAHLTFSGTPTGSLPTALTADIVAGSDTIELGEDPGFIVGDEVWIGIDITPAFIADHGMEGRWGFSADQWRPFFRRTITTMEPAADGTHTTIGLDVSLPYALKTRDGLRMERVEGSLEEVGLQGISISNATDWESAWAGSQVHAVAFDGVHDAWVRDLVSVPGAGTDGSGAPSAHHLQSSGLLIRNSRRVTVAESHLGHSQHRGEGGNGYLFEVRTSNQVLIRDSTATAGRHNFIQNWDFGTSDLVLLRVESHGGEAFTGPTDPAGVPACSETHHALAIGVLLDNSTITDCWSTVNRRDYSSGAGHTATESVVWNVAGEGILSSMQVGRGYVIGTAGLTVRTVVTDAYDSEGTTPEDFTEGIEGSAGLVPISLFSDQLARRLAR